MKQKKYSFHFSETEIKQLTLAVIALSFAFALILYSNEIFIEHNFAQLPLYLLYSLIAVGLAFILHEMGHKFVAQRKGFWAEFRAWPAGLLLAVAIAVLSRGGFVFAAPGAVMIMPRGALRPGLVHVSAEDMGQIGAAGPAVNMILSLIFIGLAAAFPFALFFIAAQVNAWLAIFNLIPFGMLDGFKIIRWSKAAWGGMMGISILIFLSMLFI